MNSPLRRSVFVALCTFGAGLFNASGTPQPADVIFQNGAVYTMSPKQEWAQSVAVRGKEIVFVGSNAGAAKLKGPGTTVIDLHGRMLMPGFVEGHIHPLMGACTTRGADLQYSSHDELMAYLRKYEQEAPDHGLIDGLVRGMGWRYSVFPLSGPTRQELDAIWPEDLGRPVMFTSVDGHSAWLNTAALNKIPAADKAKDGFVKDPVTHEPTGYVVEGEAQKAALDALGPFTPEFITEGLEEWLPKAAAVGITAVFDAGMAVTSEDVGFQIYQDLENRGLLPIRIVGSLFDNRPDFDAVQVLKMLQEKFHSELVQVNVLKIIMDGTDADGSAAMLQPYVSDLTSTGHAFFTPQETRELITQADAAGFDVHVHCIGDRAARQTLDGIAGAIKSNPRRDRRHTIAHNQLTARSDTTRFRRLGVIAQFSGQWHCRDGDYWEGVTIKQWGRERASREYRIGDILRNAGKVSLGTDWPAGSNSLVFEPLHAIQVVTTRRDWDNPAARPLPAPRNRLTLAQALRANTIGAAYQIRLEGRIGSIEKGKLADLIVLDKNLFAIKLSEISKAKVDMTMMNGRFTHGGPVEQP